jgi:DNA polymerase-3 subunit epsilon
VIDVETSGLSPEHHHLLQVAVVVLDVDGTVVDRWSSYVRPRWWPFTRTGPTWLHGITRRRLRRGRPVAEVLREVARRTDGAVLVAHNAAFDTEFLLRAARQHGVPLRWVGQLCTLQLSRRLDPDRQLSHRLADVCARYGIEVDRPHDALADAEATAALLPHLLAAHGVPPGPTTSQLDALAS